MYQCGELEVSLALSNDARSVISGARHDRHTTPRRAAPRHRWSDALFRCRDGSGTWRDGCAPVGTGSYMVVQKRRAAGGALADSWWFAICCEM